MMVYDPHTANVSASARQQVYATGARVRFSEASGAERSGVVSACFPDGICHVRLDHSSLLIAAHVSDLSPLRGTRACSQ